MTRVTQKGLSGTFFNYRVLGCGKGDFELQESAKKTKLGYISLMSVGLYSTIRRYELKYVPNHRAHLKLLQRH